VNAAEATAELLITINGSTGNIIMKIDVVGNDLILTGRILNIGDYNAARALDSLNVVCGEWNKHKVWPDVEVKTIIRNFKDFREE
jgi:hypothetical protein